MRVFWVALLGCMFLVGCGKTPAAKEAAQVNSETLTLPQADATLAGQATKTAQATLPPQNAVAANVVVNADAGPLVDTAVPAATSGAAAATSEAAGAASEMFDATAIQTALKNLGLYTGSIDGKIGPKTKEAIMEFQKQNNLTADGKVGPKTWSLLQKALEQAPATATKK